MKKLALKLDDLRVETFTTAGPPAARGTVAGHYGTTHTQIGASCEPTCQGSCGGDTCDYTCSGFRTFGPEAHCVICCPTRPKGPSSTGARPGA
ncbi:MAG TPA: hypothetical protein VFX98_06600 [Longimicrobiaceae bacterium]|nr:hypothetical protein [Longimicrobiaceae bacterium]